MSWGCSGCAVTKSSCRRAVFALPNDQVALFLRHLWATDGSVRWDGTVGQGRIYYASTSRRLVDDVAQLLLRVGVFARIARVRKAGYRDCWHLYIYGAENQTAVPSHVGVHGMRGESRHGRSWSSSKPSRATPTRDTVPKEVWSRVETALVSRRR